MSLTDIEIYYSEGLCRNGKRAAYIKPANCDNMRRRVTGFDYLLLKESIEKTAKKWYEPLQYYKVNGLVIGSNSPENALKEYWRVCERYNMNKPFPVELIEPEEVPAPADIAPGMPTIDRQ